MKKVMVGILILIPILILFIVAMVSNIISMQAWISVEDIQLTEKWSERTAENISLSLDGIQGKTISIYDYVNVKVLPEKANKYTIEWKIDGNVTYTDEEYQEKYEAYVREISALKSELAAEYPVFSTNERRTAYNQAKIKYPDDSTKIIDEMAKSLVGIMSPAVSFVSEDEFDVDSNSTGKFIVSSYCNFTVKVVAENVSKTLSVSVVGDNVERVTIGNINGEDNNISVGEAKRLVPNYTPIDSIVNYTIWHSDNEDVATVDQNGVVSAKSAGTANITVQASVHSSEQGAIQYINSSAYTVNVTANGASRKYGQTLYTARTSLTIEELGIDSDATAVEGCTIIDGLVTVTSDKAVIATAKGNFEIYSVEENSIAIANASFFENKENGYVLAVGEHTLKLGAVFSDELALGKPSDVEWASSDTDVATVNENGEVKGLSNGVVVITATDGNGKSASLTLKVRKKLASIQLRTSDSSLAVGVAKETVFASERYVDVSTGGSKVANSTNIVVQGEPRDATASELAEFYDSYVFEIVSGGEYAHFDETVANKLVFDSALEGKGKQNIVVRVSARYPKYEGISKFTTEEVTIKAIYGVAVTNIAQLRNAAKNQNEYAKAEGNYIGHEMTYDINPEGGRYFVYTQHGSHKTYAICLESNIAFEKNADGTGKYINYADSISFYGDLYGNNKMISAITGQVSHQLVRISWSNVTFSNVILRANSHPEDKEISSAQDTKSFKGDLVIIGSDVHWDYYRVVNVKFEYCIMENAVSALSFRNNNLELTGCIIRNLLSAGMVVPQRIFYRDSDKTYHPYYSHIKIHNLVFSNTLGSLMAATYEKFAVKPTPDGKGEYRFVPGDEKANYAYVMENFYEKGINTEIEQTGFMEAYNWQDVGNAALFSTGDASYDEIIKQASGNVLRNNSAFANYRYVDKDNTCWLHVAFVVAGLSFEGSSMYTEVPSMKVTLSDKDSYYTLDTRTIKKESKDFFGLAGETILGSVPIFVYGYPNTAKITPYSTYQINSAFIDRMHG